jgi:hypothetical protein
MGFYRSLCGVIRVTTLHKVNVHVNHWHLPLLAEQYFHISEIFFTRFSLSNRSLFASYVIDGK